MSVDDVARELRLRAIPTHTYCLIGGLPNEAYTIEFACGRWWTYYSERGLRSGLREFASESEACETFLRDVLRAFPDTTG